MEGLLAHWANGLDPETDLDTCRSQSFILLYQLLFIMYAEDRKLLPYGVNATYTNNRSLGRLRQEIAYSLGSSQAKEIYSKNSTAIFDQLHDLFDLIDRGHRTYGVPAYNGGLFDNESHVFLVEKRISDWYMASVIDQLSRASDPELPDAGLFRVDYRDLAIQHLGAVYEGLLELIPRHAKEAMVVVSRTSKGQLIERFHPKNEPTPAGYTPTGESYPRGAIYLETEKGERRASGSYYTPDHIVQYIVENTLDPLCQTVSQRSMLKS